jgi:hypothetical protein
MESPLCRAILAWRAPRSRHNPCPRLDNGLCALFVIWLTALRTRPVFRETPPDIHAVWTKVCPHFLKESTSLPSTTQVQNRFADECRKKQSEKRPQFSCGRSSISTYGNNY